MVNTLSNDHKTSGQDDNNGQKSDQTTLSPKPMTYNSITSGITTKKPVDDNADADNGLPDNNNISSQVGSAPKSAAKVNSPLSANEASIDPEKLLTDKTYPEDLEERWTRWKCLNCGYVYEGIKPLLKCPRCQNEDPDKFDDAD